MMIRANCSLMARRVLQTWQMKLVWLVSNRMTLVLEKAPVSRRRFCKLGAAQSCWMRTATQPLRGQRTDLATGLVPVAGLDRLHTAHLHRRIVQP